MGWISEALAELYPDAGAPEPPAPKFDPAAYEGWLVDHRRADEEERRQAPLHGLRRLLEAVQYAALEELLQCHPEVAEARAARDRACVAHQVAVEKTKCRYVRCASGKELLLRPAWEREREADVALLEVQEAGCRVRRVEDAALSSEGVTRDGR